MTDVGNGRCYETDDDERYHKAKKLAEDSVEGEERSDAASLKKLPKITPSRMARMILAKSGILILFISFVLLFACKGTIFLTKSQFLYKKMPSCLSAEGHKLIILVQLVLSNE